MTAEYRYYSADILTGNVLAEMPLYGVYFSRVLSAAGDFTGTFRLGTGLHNDASLLAGSEPGKVAMYVERDGSLVWGGIIWSRTWAEESLTCQLSGQTFESIFDHVALTTDFVYQGVDQMTIFKALIDSMQTQYHNNFGLDTSKIGTSGVPRTVLIPGYEFHYVQEGIDQVVGVDNGIDYTIDILPSSTPDHPQKVIRAGYPIIGDTENTSAAQQLTYDYPGNIDNFWWPESASSGGTVFVGIGAGSGVAMLKSVQASTSQLNAGYPAWWIVNSYKDIIDQGTVNATTVADRTRFGMPVSVPTFDINSDRAPQFQAWNRLGANFTVHIESPRFPNGKDVVSRMVGWELQIADSDNTELLKLTIAGDDNA